MPLINVFQLTLSTANDFQLVERAQQHSPIVIFVMVLCFALISIARLSQQNIFLVLLSGLWNFESIEELNRKGIRESQFVSLVLSFHFFVASTILLYTVFFLKGSTFEWKHVLLSITPTLVVLFQSFAVRLVSQITKKATFGGEINFLSSSLFQLAGVVLLVELLIIYFQPSLTKMAESIVLYTIIFFFGIRVIRGFFHAFNDGIRWYYIILYLWTVEILPILVCLKLILDTKLVEV